MMAMVFAAFSAWAVANEASSQRRPTGIERRVIASLPSSHGHRADVLARLDLTRPFATRTHWTFLVARLPGSHLGGGSPEPVAGGALAECFVDASTPRCQASTPPAISSSAWFSTPVHFDSATVVVAGPGHTEPRLLVKTGSAYGGDGSHAIFTQLFAYERSVDRFKLVFSNITGSNNNQETRFVAHGPLRGDVLAAVPTSTAPYAYWISVYVRSPTGDRLVRALRYRSATRYGDGIPLAVIDAEMPSILAHFGQRHPGEPLPIPDRLPPGCFGHLFLRRGVEWCRR